MTRVTLLSPTSGRPTATWRPCRSRVAIGDRVRRVLPSYGHADPGALLAVVNSDGRVEVAVRDRSAAERTGAGEVVRLDPAAGGSAPTGARARDKKRGAGQAPR